MSTLRSKSFRRILLIKPSAVGDVLHTLPVLVKLRARCPQAQIDWLLTPEIAELVGHHPALSNAVLFERRIYSQFGRSWSASAALFRLLGTLWNTSYDLVVDLHGQFRSALLTLATGAAVRIGFDRPRPEAQASTLQRIGKDKCLHGWTGAREGAWMAYTHRIPIPTLDVHAIDRYLWVGPLLGLDDGPAEYRLSVPAAARGRVQTLLQEHGLAEKPFAVLVPGTVWETKHWRVEGFAEVGRLLRQRGLAVVLAGSCRERERCRQVANGCPGAHDLCGLTTLSDLAALVNNAVLCVTNDSGSMHLNVALGKPVVSVFGPTDPLWIGPYGRPGAVARANVPCSPCYLKNLRSCRHEHVCMTDVSAAMVMERVDRILAGEDMALGRVA